MFRISRALLKGHRSFSSCRKHLCVKATSCLQEQRQVGLDLAAVGVGSVLSLALQCGDLVLESMIPPAGTQKTGQNMKHTAPGERGAWSPEGSTYRSCSTFLSRAYSRSVTSIFWYRSCRACRDVHTSAAPSLESTEGRRQKHNHWSWRLRRNHDVRAEPRRS